MQDHFEKVAMDRALELGGKKTFELLDEAVQRFTESLKYTDSGGKDLRSEIAGYRKGLLELYRAQLLKGVQYELVSEQADAAVSSTHQDAQTTQHSPDLHAARVVFEKEITVALEQLADSYTTLAETTAAILAAVDSFSERISSL